MKIKLSTIVISFFLCASLCAQSKVLLADSIKVIRDGNYGLSIAKKISDDTYGIIDTNANTIVSFEYDAIYPFYEKLALAYKDDKCGFLNLEGEVGIPFDYELGNHFVNGKAVVSKNYVKGVIDTSNQVVLPFKYTALATHDHRFYAFQLEPKKSGIMDSNEQVIIDPIYDILLAKNDSLWAGRRNNKFYILKNNGDFQNVNAFDQLGSMNSAGLIRFSIGNKVGFLDDQFKTVIPAQYERSGVAIGSIMSVFDGNKWGFIDEKNQPITDFIYDKVQSLNKEYCIVVKDRKSNVIDQNANVMLDQDCKEIRKISNSNLIYIDRHIYDSSFQRKTKEEVVYVPERLSGLRNGMIKVRVKDSLIWDKIGYLDSLGNMKVEGIYDEGDHFYEEKCTAVRSNGKWSFINTNGKKQTSREFDSVAHFGSFDNCNYIVEKDDLYGCFIGDKLLYEPQFEKLIVDQNQVLIYKKGNKYGIIDLTRNRINTVLYDSITANISDYFVVDDGLHGFIDKDLKTIIPIEYEYLAHGGLFFIAKMNGKYGTISESNEIIQDFVYDKIVMKPFTVVKVYKNGKVGILSSNGSELISPKYDEIRDLDWFNVEVVSGSKTEIINIAQLESKVENEKKK